MSHKRTFVRQTCDNGTSLPKRTFVRAQLSRCMQCQSPAAAMASVIICNAAFSFRIKRKRSLSSLMSFRFHHPLHQGEPCVCREQPRTLVRRRRRSRKPLQTSGCRGRAATDHTERPSPRTTQTTCRRHHRRRHGRLACALPSMPPPPPEVQNGVLQQSLLYCDEPPLWMDELGGDHLLGPAPQDRDPNGWIDVVSGVPGPFYGAQR